MVRVLTSGPELAESLFTEDPLTAALDRVKPGRAAGRPGAAASARSLRRARDLAGLFPVAYHLAVAALLTGAGFPSWRIAVLLVAGAMQKVNCLAWRARARSLCVNTDADDLGRFAVLSQSALVATTWVAAAMTGGVRSPLLVTIVCAYLAAVAAAGDRRETRLLLGVTALGACGLALLPAEWTGPGLHPSLHATLTVVGIAGVGALLAPVLVGVREKREELARACEDVASDALAHARALEQIGAKVAHELKNPLTGVKALVQLGARNPAERASRDRLEVVEREVTRMQGILQNYLSFTRPLQGMDPARVELGPLVSDTLLLLSARADAARVRLFARGDAVVDADPRRLKEALLNLVANAIEATPPGGEVVVEVRPARDDVEIHVRDTGRGMPPETLRRIGTPFFTTRDEGTGLGVVLARTAIAQHGGTLRYESEPGAGTRVRITLPRGATGARDVACAAGR